MANGKLDVNGEIEDYTDWKGARSPAKAIKEACRECMGGSATEVKHCSSKICPLKPFRTGKNPFLAERVYTDDQRLEMKERMLQLHAKGNNKDGQ